MTVQIFFNLQNHPHFPLRGRAGQLSKRKRVLGWCIYITTFCLAPLVSPSSPTLFSSPSRLPLSKRKRVLGWSIYITTFCLAPLVSPSSPTLFSSPSRPPLSKRKRVLGWSIYIISLCLSPLVSQSFPLFTHFQYIKNLSTVANFSSVA